MPQERRGKREVSTESHGSPTAVADAAAYGARAAASRRPAVYFNSYRLSGRCGTVAADDGVLVAPDGGSRRLAAPVRGSDDGTISGDGWTFEAAAGWVIREGARRGDYEVVPRQP